MTAKIDAVDFTEASKPEALFNAWFDEAELTEINDANAMTLATVDQNGMPNARVVLLKGLDPRGRELMANPKVCLCFHWKSLRRQVRIRGTAEPVSAAEADAYYASRPMGSRIGAWASQQSRPLASRAELIDAVAHFEREFEGINPARPRYWSGYRISFARETTDMPWKKTRLYP